MGVGNYGAWCVLPIDSVMFSNTLCQSCTFHRLKYLSHWVIRILAPMPQALKSWVLFFSHQFTVVG